MMLALTVAAAPAQAVLLDLEDLTGPSTYAEACGVTACPQTITEHTAVNDVTLSGGVILSKTLSLPANESTVYASASDEMIGLDAHLANPITITFSQPVTTILIDVINGLTTEAGYRVADDAGNSSIFMLASNAGIGATTIGFATTGHIVTITSLSSDGMYDMFIDNIRFDVPIACDTSGCREATILTPLRAVVAVPEPASASLLGAGLAAIALRRRRANA